MQEGKNIGVCVEAFFFLILKSELKYKSTYGLEIGTGKACVGRWITFDVKLIFHVCVVQFQLEY